MTDEDLFQSRCATARRFIDAVNAGDVDAILSLYAPDALVQDPVGRPDREFQGAAELRRFYQGVVARGARLRITGPIRDGHGNTIAAPVVTHVPGSEIDVITTTRFDAGGRICRYQAYWGPANIRKSQA